jgi:hypothetical protein
MDLFSRFIDPQETASLSGGGDSVRCFEKWVVRETALNIAFNGAQKKHVTLITGGGRGVAL